jgi:Na+-driven multidrug efflux pump
MSRWTGRAIDLLGLTSAVRYSLAAKGWQVVALPITLWLIAKHFTPEIQGFYYTFFSLVALQTFLELGLHNVILNVASHEADVATLGNRGTLSADARPRERVMALSRFVLKWYGIGSLILVGSLGAGGYAFLSASGAGSDTWLAPWVLLVFVSAVQFVVSPFNYLLEGLGEVVAIARMRWLISIFNTLVTWMLIVRGAGLWTVTGAAAAMLLVNMAYLARLYPSFFREVRSARDAQGLDWRTEIWPMQWRLGVQGIVSFLLYSLFVPVLFHYRGAAEAGRFGMTLQILGAIQVIGLAWLQAGVPSFGRLIAAARFADLDREWRRVSLFTVAASLAGNLAFVAGVIALAQFAPDLAARVSEPLVVALLGLAYWLAQPIQCMAAYLRAFKREALTWVGLSSGLVGGLLVLIGGRAFGSTGAAAAYLGVTAFIALPAVSVIWLRARISWRHPTAVAHDPR